MHKIIDKNSCLLLLSGGQDSATCLALASDLFKKVYTISFDYGQRHYTELEHSKKLSILAECEAHYEVPISSFSYLANHGLSSTLLSDGDISGPHEKNPELPASFVPGRNYIFLGLAGALSFQLGIKNIITGVCQTDFSGYPDCRDLSIKAIQNALSLCLDYKITIHTPLMWKTKAETVLMMKGLGKLEWYVDTMTCYEGKFPPCMKCPACKLRTKGFEESGVEDPLVREAKKFYGKQSLW